MVRQIAWKKLGILLVAGAIAFSTAACSSSKDSAEDTPKPTASGPEAMDSGNNLEPITFTYFSEDPSPNWNNMQDEVGKVITEKTGVTLKAEFAVGDPAQKIGLIASTGQYPDLISPKGDLGKLVDAGAMIDLAPLIEQYAPNIKKVIGPYMKRLRYSKDDPSIYVIPSYSGVGQITFDAGGGFELQHAVVQELGYPEIRTVQDFENAIKAYKEKHPQIDGKPTIGLTLNSDDWHMYISVTNPAFFTTGAPDDGEFYIDPNTYEAKYHFLRPEEKEYFRWLNHMNDIGLLDPETFSQKYDQYKAKIATGRVLGLIDQKWDYQDGENALKTAGKFERGYGHYPVTLTTEFKDHSFQDTGFMAGYGVGITTNCKDPVRAIKFLDFLASEEGQILINWGIEGKHYNVENGVRVIPKKVNDRKVNDAANFSKETGIGLYALLSAHYGDGVKDSTGNYYTTNFPDQIVASYNDVEKEVLKNYNATTWKDLFPKEDEFPVKPWGAAWNIPVPGDSELAVLQNQMKDITWSYIPKAVLAKPGDFDKIWDEYLQKLKDAGVDKMDELYTQIVKERVALWND
ncbi:MAG TPA: ABC transporter substrate-binding protein [Bacilli bacterium]